jgi:hypothetical protein
MTPEQIESGLKHLATKEDLHRELRSQFYWLVVIQISLLGIAIAPIYFFLAHLASRVH